MQCPATTNQKTSANFSNDKKQQMKSIKTLWALIILLTSHSSSAQTKDDYLLKSKHQKTTALVMLGGGACFGIVGSVVAIAGTTNLFRGQIDKAGNNIGAAGILLITGGAAMLGSIPFFIASGKNRRNSLSLSFTNSPTPALVKNITGTQYLPSIRLQFNLQNGNCFHMHLRNGSPAFISL